MIDHTKVNNLPVSVRKILTHKQLIFPLSNVATTGEMLNRAQVAHYGMMEFVVKGGYVKLKGSYHKHAQGGINYSDFTFPDIQRVIEELIDTFQFDPKDADFNFIEIGVNIEVPADPSSLIKNFLRYRHKEFETLPVTGKGFGRKCELQRIIIKVYNKSLQYGLPFHLLRFEVKVTRMEFLKQYGIDRLTMDDLKRPDVYPKLLNMLLDVFDRILIFNPDLDMDSIQNQKDRELVMQGRFPEYWNELPRQRKSEQIKRFTELAGTNNLKKELIELISLKWNKLLNPDKLTTYSNGLRNAIPDKLTTFKNDPEIQIHEKSGHINTTINCYSKRCPITGLDISMQDDRSKFISPKGVEFYYNNYPVIFGSKLYSLLSDRMRNEKLEKQFKEIAHSARRKDYSPKYHHKQKVSRMMNENGGMHLFDQNILFKAGLNSH